MISYLWECWCIISWAWEPHILLQMLHTKCVSSFPPPTSEKREILVQRPIVRVVKTEQFPEIERTRGIRGNYRLNITVQSQNPTRNFIVWKYYARGRGVEEWMRNWKMSNLVSVLQFTIAKNILTGREIWGKFKISVGIISEATTMEWVALEAPLFIIFTSNFFYFTFSSFS